MTNQELKRELEACLAQIRRDLDYAIRHVPNYHAARYARHIIAVQEALKRLEGVDDMQVPELNGLHLSPEQPFGLVGAKTPAPASFEEWWNHAALCSTYGMKALMEVAYNAHQPEIDALRKELAEIKKVWKPN